MHQQIPHRFAALALRPPGDGGNDGPKRGPHRQYEQAVLDPEQPRHRDRGRDVSTNDQRRKRRTFGRINQSITRGILPLRHAARHGRERVLGPHRSLARRSRE
jgi:hypothetical protein